MNLETELQFSDADLLVRLRSTEDNFVERKSFNDLDDVLKTAVAFANTLPVGAPGFIFVPVRDDGTVEVGKDLDRLTKSAAKQISKAFPAIASVTRAFQTPEGEVLAIVICGSSNRPHFAGPSYIRVGSESKKASEEQFNELIATRNSKAAEILRWLGKEVTLAQINPESARRLLGRISGVSVARILKCTPHYVNLQIGDATQSRPLSSVEISFDPTNQRLQLELN